MSYEGKMLKELAMPTRKAVEQSLLRVLLQKGGVIKEFGSGQEIVDEVGDEFRLNQQQRSAFLETVYRKENRVKKSLLWHRLLFRAADSLARDKLVSRPTQTLHLTNRREWMLTEKGFEEALKLSGIPASRKDSLPTKSFEVQEIVQEIFLSPRPDDYDPFDKNKKVVRVTRESVLRTRGFRQAVIEAYDYRCAVCGLKINSPDFLSWEVEAAHIVPHHSLGRDDIFNGIALCHLHHWAFDVGWFTLLDDYSVQLSPQVARLPRNSGIIWGCELLRPLKDERSILFLPSRPEIHPHSNAMQWHRQNIFCHK